MTRRVVMAVLMVVVLGIAGSAEAQQPQGSYGYSYGYYGTAPQQNVRVRRSRAPRQGLFSRMMELERRKNAWLAQRFGLR
ncbi:hypothetical protein [Maioricimonas sp. JC845]|uniref:hypothetical protein n=1 Tax=Maioricimonas sp. JC845 TaxID=3232138 RepID=UPI00345A2456